MHQALKIDEIIRLICINLLDRRSNLLRLALTCKAFNQPGLDHLWSLPMVTREIFWPLVVCGVLELDGKVLDLTRIPTTHELDHYALYAARVRDVHSIGDGLTLKTCLSLFTGRYNEIHFPQIRRLETPIENILQISIAKLFISPSLRYLHLFNTHATPPNWQSILGWFTTSPIQLENLNLYLGAYDTDSASKISLLLSLMPKLKRFELEATPVVLSRITLLPMHIKDLRLITISPWEFPSHSTIHPIQIAAHRSLQSLTVWAPLSNIDTETLTRTASVSRLKNLDLVLDTMDAQGGTIRVILNNLASARPHLELQRLVLALYNRTSRSPYTIDSLDLAPLSSSSFSALAVLEITGDMSYVILDSDLESIAKGCPRLTTIRLATLYSGYFQLDPVITLEGLIRFARELQGLKSATIPIKAFPMAIQPDLNGRIAALSEWRMSYSKVIDPHQIAAMLKCHLPKLQVIGGSGEDMDHQTFIRIWEEMPQETIEMNKMDGSGDAYLDNGLS